MRRHKLRPNWCPDPQRNDDAIRKSYHDASRQIAMVDAVLADQPFVAGSGFSFADIVIALVVRRWICLGEDVADARGKRPDLSAVVEWYERLAARPAFPRAYFSGATRPPQ